MIVLELIIVLLAIFLGARLGGIGIGFAGGLGVLVLAAIGVKPVIFRSMLFPLSWRLSLPFLPCRLQVVWTIWFIKLKNCCVRTRNTSRSLHLS